MAKMINSKYGWTWSQFVKADADCDRYWQAKKAEKRSLIRPQKNRQELHLKARRRQAKKSISTFSLLLLDVFVKENGGNYDEKCFNYC